MSDYTQKEETEIVRDAMTLTAAIQIEQEELARLRKERFQTMPAAPIRKILTVPQVQAQLPPAPKSQFSFEDYLKGLFQKGKEKSKKPLRIILIIMIALIVLAIILSIMNKSAGSAVGGLLGTAFTAIIGLAFTLVPIFLVVAFARYLQEKKEKNQELAQSSEYQNAVARARREAEEKQQAAKEETAQKQAQVDAKYQSDKEHYDTVTVPAYQKELAEWKETQAKKIAMMEEDLTVNRSTLETLYETTRLVSNHYRELWILRWLYDDMRTSDHDIRYATELLDRDRQRVATEQSGQMTRQAIGELRTGMMEGFAAVYAAVEEGNEELARTRRDQNLANTAGIIQRHHLNKAVKEQNQMLEERFKKKK